MTSLRVRAASAGDVPALAALHAFVHELHVHARPDFFKARERSAVEAELVRLLEDENARVLLAEEDGAPIGYVLALFHERPGNAFCHPRRWCEIDQLAVHEDHRKKGVARRLIETAIEEATTRGIQTIEATTWWWNETAQATFRALGFGERIVRFEKR